MAAVHLAVTVGLVLLVMGWSMWVLDGAVTYPARAPLGLQIASALQVAFLAPMLYPAAALALKFGFADPIRNPIYWFLALINSLAAAWLILLIWDRASRQRRQRRA